MEHDKNNRLSFKFSVYDYFENDRKHFTDLTIVDSVLIYGDNGLLVASRKYIQKPFHNLLSMYYSNGQLMYTREMKDSYTTWNQLCVYDINGKKLNPGTLRDGNGTLISYYQNGVKRSESWLENGKIKGNMGRWTSDGKTLNMAICESIQTINGDNAALKNSVKIVAMRYDFELDFYVMGYSLAKECPKVVEIIKKDAENTFALNYGKAELASSDKSKLEAVYNAVSEEIDVISGYDPDRIVEVIRTEANIQFKLHNLGSGKAKAYQAKLHLMLMEAPYYPDMICLIEDVFDNNQLFVPEE